MKYWLIKSEPHVYGIKQLKKEKRAEWDGVRNYQARNMMRDAMKVGDYVLFYHSNCKPPHIAGIAKVCKEGYPDFTSWDSESNYFDEKSSPEKPRWFMVDIKPVTPLKETVSLDSVRNEPSLSEMPLIRRGQRLSIQPVQQNEFETICAMGGVELGELE